MEVGEYETNTLVVNNIAYVAFRVYKPIVLPSSSIYTFSPSDVEKALRSDGHLVFVDSRRQGIWCFRLMRKDGSSIGAPTKTELTAAIDVGPYKLRTVDYGAFDPSLLLKGRSAAVASMNTSISSSSPATLPIDAGVRGVAPSSSQSTTASSASDPDAHNAQPAAPEHHRVFPQVSAKVVYNFFISAVLASLSSAYCSKAKAVALNHRTFLLPPLDPLWDGDEKSRSDGRALVATLRVSLTTAGSLLIGLSHSILHGMGCSEWACFAGVPPAGCLVLTAPWGKLATVHGVYPQLASPDTPSFAVARLKKKQLVANVPQIWKSFAAKMLETRGTSPSILQNSTWLRIEFVLDEENPNCKPVVILWPSVLCFWSRENVAAKVAPFDKLDPIAHLREAYLEEVKGEEAILLPKEEDVPMDDVRSALAGKEKSSVDGQPLAGNRGFGGVAAPSAFVAAAAAAAGAVYPTPPDGVPNPVGATPTFDGTTSSPGNAAVNAAPPDADTAMTDRRDAEDAFGHFWEENERKREGEEQPFMEEPDNMFGDLGADMFGGDITDADFNFFDEKPDVPAAIGPPPAALIKTEKVELDTALAQVPSQTEEERQQQQQPAPAQDAAPVHGEAADEKREARPASPVFAKPELRHARSHLPDEGRGPFSGSGSGTDAVGTSLGDKGIKRPPSPFDAMTVFKRVRASAQQEKPPTLSVAKQAALRRSNLFQGLTFTNFMIENNKKYEQNGKFGFHWAHPEADMMSDVSSVTSPTAFRRPVKKKRPEPTDASPEWAALISSITRGLKSSSLQTQSLVDDSSGDTSSVSSKADSSSEDTEDDESLAVSSVAQKKSEVSEAVPSPEAAAELSRAYSEGVWDLPIVRYFADPMPPPTELSYSDEDIIDVAQILTQQVTRMTIRSYLDEDEGQSLPKSKLRQALVQRARYSVATLQDVLSGCLAEAKRCTLKPYLEVPDIPHLGPPNRLQPRPPPGAEQLRTNLYPIPMPHLEIRRHEWTLSIAPTAIEFWEVLGLEPLHGAKDIRAACLFPDYDGLASEVGGFLGRMRIAYESLRLGAHERLSAKSGVPDGLVPFDASVPSTTATPRSEFPAAAQVHKLAQALAAEDAAGKSLVIYVVYCAEVTGAVVDACLAFQRLSQLYEIAATSRNNEPLDLVLQLIPTSFLASPTSLVVPSPASLLRLSLEVYDRCASPRGPRPSPSFLLEQPPPRMLDLKLSTMPSVDVQRENSCIHVAYARSADERWVTAAWTDTSGWRQFSASYWVGRKGSAPAPSSFSMVAQEIWDNTCGIVANLRVHWRAIITKCGPMEQEEMDIWTELAKNESRASISATLVSVDSQPSLELIPPVVTVPPTVLSMLSAATPAPTPQGSVFSPEQSGGNPVTPAGYGATPTTPAAPTPATPSGGGGGGGGGGSGSGLAAGGGGGGGPHSPAVPNTPASMANAASKTADANLAAAASDPNTVSDIDGNVVLVDITDTTWGAVAAHRLNTSSTWVDLRPALVSGYLVKRGGMGRDDAPVVLEVNVVRAEGSPRAYEAFVRELLSAYRGLGTLARARGILDSDRDVRPWHIAAAERAAKALGQWM